MDTMEPVQILDLVTGINPDCPTAATIMTNWQNPCMERRHDSDGCSFPNIVTFNNAGN